MRKINKGDHSPLFDNFVTKYSPTHWDEIHAEGDPKDAYQDTKLKILIDEQNQLCGYTEIYINELNCHIDHYKKRSVFPELTFDWNNLIVATYDDNFGARYKDNKSGIQANDYNNIFNPVVDNVENYFDYTTWGEVTPKTAISEVDNQKAIKTIEVFNLNHNSLKNRRKNLISMISCYREMAKEEILTALENLGFVSVINQTLEL